jgi:hypothetical protein
MGGWVGGQAQYVMVPYADFNLLKFPDKEQALSKIRDLTMLTDILPTGFHGAVSAGVEVGSTVYVAGAGPVGLAAAASAQILGAAVVLIGDLNDERLFFRRIRTGRPSSTLSFDIPELNPLGKTKCPNPRYPARRLPQCSKGVRRVFHPSAAGAFVEGQKHNEHPKHYRRNRFKRTRYAGRSPGSRKQHSVHGLPK